MPPSTSSPPPRRIGSRRRPVESLPVLRLRDFLKAIPSAPVVAPTSVDDTTGVTFALDHNDEFGVCVAPETRVLRADLQWVPAGELREGDRVVGFDEEPRGNGGRAYRSAVVEYAEIIRKTCYELTFEDGTTIVCAADHRWLAQSTVQGELRTQKWVATRDLKCGPVRQSRVVKPLDVWETDTSREAGYLAAAFDGEGNVEQGPRPGMRVCFAQTENEMLAETERCLKELGYRFGHTVSIPRARRTDGTARKDKHRLALSPRSESVRFLGSVRPFRLLPKFDIDKLGRINGNVAKLVSKALVGEHDVVMLATSAKTYLAEGFASHNCGPTGVDNLRRLITQLLTGTEVDATWAEIVAWYRSQNPDFDEADPGGPGDRGVELQKLLAWLVKQRVILGFAAVDPHDDDELRAALYLFLGLYCGADLQQAQQAQTDAGTWEYVPGSAEWGGHCFIAVGYEADSFTVVTWNVLVEMTKAWRQHQLDEVYVVLLPEHVQHPDFRAGFDLAKFAAAYTQITGRPFPDVTPPEPPSPRSDALVAAARTLAADQGVVAWSVANHSGTTRRVAALVRAVIRAAQGA
jgi:hypothetical protein